MSEFRKYQHIERVGTPEVEGLLNGKCYIFPKIDGTNASFWTDNHFMMGGSRNRQLAVDNDNAGFYNWVLEQQNLRSFSLDYPNLRLYGEWLVHHTLKTYNKYAWRKFYVFDVMDGERYLSYEEYASILEEYKIDYIPPICIVENPTYERIIDQLQKNTFLVEDGKWNGEGVVVKRYDFVNKYGRVTWGKIVTNEFKSNHGKKDPQKITEKTLVEQSIVDEYVTESLVEKEFAKIEEWTSRMIPKLLGIVYYCLITEESWHFIKKYRNPTINFKTLSYLCNAKVKELKPELFWD